MKDAANFIALIEAHETLLGQIKEVSRAYFKEAVELNGGQPERTYVIGNALDDLHIPVEANLKRLRALLDAQNIRQSSTQAEAGSRCA